MIYKSQFQKIGPVLWSRVTYFTSIIKYFDQKTLAEVTSFKNIAKSYHPQTFER